MTTETEIEVMEPEKVGSDLLGKFTESGREIIAVAVSHKGLAIVVKEPDGTGTAYAVF